MAIGILLILVGGGIAVNGFSMDPNFAPQQTVQYLSFVCASIFIVGGFLAIKLQGVIKALQLQNEPPNNTVSNQVIPEAVAAGKAFIVMNNCEMYNNQKKLIRVLTQKEIVFSLSRYGNWLKVQTKKGEEGWCLEENLRAV